MAAFRKVKGLGLAAAVSISALLSGTASAQYDNALEAYLNSPAASSPATAVSGALDIWQKSALAGDVRSAQVLGDVYSNAVIDDVDNDDTAPLKPSETGVVPLDLVSALAWYTIAATHDFIAYNQTNPLPEEINARAIAQLRLPQMRGQMKDDDVEKAEAMVVNLLAGGSQFDLLRLGRMYARGNGLEKNNVEALMHFYLARGRGRGANSEAVAEVNAIEKLMAQSQIETARTRADDWRPPLPQNYAELTRTEQRDALRLTELQYQELRAALVALDEEFEGNERVTQRALRALGFYWVDTIDGNLRSRASRDAISRFVASLYIDQRPDPDAPLTDKEQAKIDDISNTGTLTELQRVELMRRAAARNHPPSMHIYGVMLGRGIGVQKDGQAAIEILKAAAQQDYALAHYSAGLFYANGITAARPLDQSVRGACFHLSRAAVLGYSPANKDLKTYCRFD